MSPIGGARAGLLSSAGGGADIPDSKDLHLHYDSRELAYSDEATVDPFTAETGPDLPATSGTPTFNTNVKNGNPAVLYDGTDDGNDAQLSQTYAQPVHYFLVFKLQSVDTGDNEYIVGSPDGTNYCLFAQGSGSWRIDAGSGSTGGTADTNWHIANILFDGANSKLDIDQSNVISADVGGNDDGGIGFGWLNYNDTNYSNVYIGQMLGYPMDKTSKESEIESHLNDNWAVF
jgi:hypothetical protein